MGSVKKSPAPPSFTWPSLPRTTLLGLGASSSMICVKANRLGAAAAAAAAGPAPHRAALVSHGPPRSNGIRTPVFSDRCLSTEGWQDAAHGQVLV